MFVSDVAGFPAFIPSGKGTWPANKWKARAHRLLATDVADIAQGRMRRRDVITKTAEGNTQTVLASACLETHDDDEESTGGEE